MHKGVVALKEQGKWLDRLAQQADLLGEPFPGQSLAELYGDNRLLIEQHKGVIRYSSEEICIRLRFGTLSVYGEGLELARMCREQLIITGRIEGLKIIRRC